MKASYIKNTFFKTVSFMSDNLNSFVKRPGVDFTRNRRCSFPSVLLCILSMETHSLNRELRRFFSAIKSPSVSKSAFIQQRDKLSDVVFPFLLSDVNSHFPFRKTFRGYHLIACDGSDIDIPPLKDDLSTFVPSNTPGIGYHQIHLNAVFDMLEERYIDILTQPRACLNEREAFITFIRSNPLKGKCIYIADRGFFSFNVVAHLSDSGAYFILRVKAPDSKGSFLNRFCLPDSDEFDVPVDIEITRSKKKIFRDHPDRFVRIGKNRPFDLIPPDDMLSTFPVSFRIVKIALPDGDCEFLITNLPYTTFDIDTLRQVYHLRWGIETSFRFLKYNVALNCFHSIRRDFIMQEIYARVILYNLTMLIVHCVKLPQSDSRYTRRISVSDAIPICRYFLIHRLKNEEIEAMLLQYLTDIRPGRSFPRRNRSRRYVPLGNRS